MASEAVLAAVKEQYQRFPYPPVSTLEEEDPHRGLRKSFNLDIGLLGERALQPGAKVWVPGCGTRWAAMIALQFRDVHVIGSDLSERSLARQSALASALQLSNVELRCEDLAAARYESEFDFISCVGVLHHLPDPARGFEAIARALKPSGVLELMVYDRWNRLYSMRMQEILRTFDPDCTLDAGARFDLACRLLESVNHLASVPPQFKRVLRYLRSEPGFAEELADFVSHPQEHYFDVPSLVRALSNAKLRVRAWKNPARFDPKAIVRDTRVWPAIETMSMEQQAHLGHLLSNGLLELFAERDIDCAQPENATVGAIRDRVVRASAHGVRHYVGADGCVTRCEGFAKVDFTATETRFDGGERRPAVSSYGTAIDCVKPRKRRASTLPVSREIVDSILEAAWRPITIGDIASQLAQGRVADAPAEEIVRICDQLCRPPFRVLIEV